MHADGARRSPCAPPHLPLVALRVSAATVCAALRHLLPGTLSPVTSSSVVRPPSSDRPPQPRQRAPQPRTAARSARNAATEAAGRPNRAPHPRERSCNLPRRQRMLPHVQHAPSRVPRRDLRVPKRPPRLRPRVVDRASVPEASVDEHHQPPPPKHEVGPHGEQTTDDGRQAVATDFADEHRCPAVARCFSPRPSAVRSHRTAPCPLSPVTWHLRRTPLLHPRIPAARNNATSRLGDAKRRRFCRMAERRANTGHQRAAPLRGEDVGHGRERCRVNLPDRIGQTGKKATSRKPARFVG